MCHRTQDRLPEAHFDVLALSNASGAATLDDFYPVYAFGRRAKRCYTSIALSRCVLVVCCVGSCERGSSFNPPTRARTTAGDLFYVEIVLADEVRTCHCAHAHEVV
jgi:hypothetical protein